MDTAVDGVHVSISMVLKWHKIFRDGQESIDDNKRPGRPTKFGDAMIDDIRHPVQEGVRIRFLFSSLRTHRALERSNLSLSLKIVCIFDMDKSNSSKISLLR